MAAPADSSLELLAQELCGDAARLPAHPAPAGATPPPCHADQAPPAHPGSDWSDTGSITVGSFPLLLRMARVLMFTCK